MSTKQIKTIFIGTPDFGIPSLKALISDEQFYVISVVTQPDKKIGRKQILTAPPIKQVALVNNIPVLQFDRIKNEEARIKALSPDLIVVVAYAQIIPKSILGLPKYGCINVHGSLLPRYRGAACVQQPILDGKTESGITIMLMDEGLDTGPILSQHPVPIENNDTAGTMFDKLSTLGENVLVPTLKNYISGKITPLKQDESKATYVQMLKKEDGQIDFDNPAKKIERFVRAMSPWPGAFIRIKNQESRIKNSKIKILETKHLPIKINKNKIGEFFCFENELALQCKNGALIVEKLQLEGKKAIDGKAYINGHLNIKKQL